MRLLSPLSGYYGGKTRLAREIVSCFPEHKCFVDLFGGGGAVIFEKVIGSGHRSCKVNIYNDIDENVVNFFRVIRDEKKLGRFLRILRDLPASRKEYYDIKESFLHGDQERTDVEKAIEYYYLSCLTFNRLLLTGYSKTAGRQRLDYSKTERKFVGARKFISEISIECLHYKRAIEFYDSQDTLFYCDPPYFGPGRTHPRKGYKNDMTGMKQHIVFLKRITSIKGLAIISGYDSFLYKYSLEEKNDFKRLEFEVSLAAKPESQARRTEVLWVSPRIKAKQVSGSIFD